MSQDSTRAWLTAGPHRAGFAVESLTRCEPYPGAEVATPRLLPSLRRQILTVTA